MERIAVLHVEKANLPLNGGSIQEFLTRLRETIRDHVMQKLSLGKNSHVWPVDVFGDHVVIEVSRYGETGGKPSHQFLSIPYSKSKPGAAGVQGSGFNFGEMTEVVRRVTYAPKTTVQKRAEELEVQKNSPELWSGVV